MIPDIKFSVKTIGAKKEWEERRRDDLSLGETEKGLVPTHRGTEQSDTSPDTHNMVGPFRGGHSEKAFFIQLLFFSSHNPLSNLFTINLVSFTDQLRKMRNLHDLVSFSSVRPNFFSKISEIAAVA